MFCLYISYNSERKGQELKLLGEMPLSRRLEAESKGRYSSIGIATRYGLDGPGIESVWGRDFPQPSRPALVPTQLPIQWIPSLFPGGKAAGA
jgi:hypothetical protein